MTKSFWKDDLHPGEAKFSGYDEKSGIRWRVSNDEYLLYLEFDTDNKAVQRNILMAGVKLYIDTSGKKKEGMYLHYPHREGGMRERPDMRPSGEDGFELGVRRDRHQVLQQMTIQIPGKALWVSGDMEYYMDLRLDKTDFSGNMVFDSTGFLNYHAGIPLNIVFPGIRQGDKTFSCGIIIEGITRPPGIETDGYGGTRGSGQGGFPGGGQRGGSPSGQRQAGMVSSGTEIWFLTELAKPAGEKP